MAGRARFQQGSLMRAKRSNGPDRWEFRWWELDLDGRRHYRKQVIGTVREFPTLAAAKVAVAPLQMKINESSPRAALQPVCVRDLIAHYKEVELNFNAVDDDPDHAKACSTKKAYRIVLDRYVGPAWGGYKVKEVRTVAVEAWLRKLALRDGAHMARGTKSRIRNIMHALFNHAIRYDWLPQNANPITHVRQSAKRESMPVILAVEEYRALLAELSLRDRVVVLLAATTGLRRSELFALQWQDVDFETLSLSVTRSIVNGVVGRCKTEASRKPVPLVASVAEDLWRWRQTTPYNRLEDWIFASIRAMGRRPLYPDMVLRRAVRPAAKRAGIERTIGWHMFRHTYATLLKANGEDLKVVQELLRHANAKITLDIYTQALTPAKREAQQRVSRLILPEPKAIDAERSGAAGGG